MHSFLMLVFTGGEWRANLSNHVTSVLKASVCIVHRWNMLSWSTTAPFRCPCLVAKSCPGFPVLHCLLEFAQIHVHWVTDAVWPSHPLPLLLSLLSVSTSIRVFSNESALSIRWRKNYDFGFNNFVSWQIEGKSGSNERFYFLGLQKSLLMVTSAMKWKKACSLEGKLDSRTAVWGPDISPFWWVF